MVIWLYMDGVNSGVSEEKTTTPVNDGVGDNAPINDGVVDAAPGNEKASSSFLAEEPVDDTALVKEEDEDSAPVKKTVDDITPVKEHVDDTASVKERAGESRENCGLVITLCVLGMMIVGLIVAIVVVNVMKGGSETGGVSNSDDSDTVQPGSIPTEDVVIKDKMEGWNGPISASTQALMFSEDVNKKLDNPDLDYSLERALDDYKLAFDGSTGDLKFQMSLVYARFLYDRLDNLQGAVQVLMEVYDIAMKSSYNASMFYDTLYKLYQQAGNRDEEDYYKREYERVMEYYWDWSNYEKE